MSSPSGEYVLGSGTSEQTRLTASSRFDDFARRVLQVVGARPDWHAIDVGCGPRGILEVLAETIGPSGRVVGLDSNPTYVTMARQLAKERQWSNVEIVEGDARATGLPAESFDFVYAQRVLINLPRPEGIVAELARLARPGGTVALVETEGVTWSCDPPHPAWTRLGEVFLAVMDREREGNRFSARALPSLLRNAGLSEVEVDVQVGLYRPGSPERRSLLQLVAATKGAMLAQSGMSEEEFTELTTSLAEHLDNPRTTVYSHFHVSARGQKP